MHDLSKKPPAYTREQAQQALTISKNTSSQLERVARLVPDLVGVTIGPAHGAGRPKWMAVAGAFEDGAISEDGVFRLLAGFPKDAGSDARLLAVLASLTKRGAKDARAPERSPVAGAVVKSTKSSVTLTVKRAGATKGFADWIDDNIDRLIAESHRSFQDETGG